MIADPLSCMQCKHSHCSLVIESLQSSTKNEKAGDFAHFWISAWLFQISNFFIFPDFVKFLNPLKIVQLFGTKRLRQAERCHVQLIHFLDLPSKVLKCRNKFLSESINSKSSLNFSSESYRDIHFSDLLVYFFAFSLLLETGQSLKCISL